MEIDVPHHLQPAVLVADRDGMFDLPVRLRADGQIAGDLGDGILFGALPNTAVVANKIIGPGVGCHGDQEPHGWAARRGAGHATRYHRSDSGR